MTGVGRVAWAALILFVSLALFCSGAPVPSLLASAPPVPEKPAPEKNDKTGKHHHRQDGSAPVDEARRAYEASDYAHAVQLLQAASAHDPSNAEIKLLLAKNYYELQQSDAAVAAAEKAVALAPQNSVYHEWLGRAFGQKAEHAMWFSAIGLARKARREFQAAVDLDQRNFSAQQALIEFDCSAPGIVGGGEDKARVEIARVADLDESEGHYARGVCRREKKNFAEADAEFAMALDAHPTSVALIYDIGDYAVRRQQGDRLLAVADMGQKLAPEDPRGAYYRAVGFILKYENLPEAEESLRAYLDHPRLRSDYPHLSWVQEWLARSLEKQGKLDAARQEYEAAIKSDPKNKNAKESLKRLGKTSSDD
ncbi:MAG TPA: tetratricopeptide repeat protein [Candidatus Acidoferrales bacterium]|nr:tetratricopeptide repeat protein [Candidatus Acidoferrales bacterium]